jgi:hypothetical protein
MYFQQDQQPPEKPSPSSEWMKLLVESDNLDEFEALLENLPTRVIPQFLTMEFLATVDEVSCLPLEFIMWYSTKYKPHGLDATGDPSEPAILVYGKYRYQFVSGEALHLALSTLAASPCPSKLLKTLISFDHQPSNLQFPAP